MKRLMAVVTVLAGSWSAYAAQPLEVRGVFLGDTQEQVESKLPDARCRDGDGVVAEVICSVRGYGPASDAFIVYALVEGTVESANIMFKSGDFAHVIAAMETKFGRGETSVGNVQNAMGATFQNREIKWEAGPLQLIATERAGRVDQSSVILESREGARAMGQRMREKREADAAGL